MGTSALVVIIFGDNQISLRRHRDGHPEVVGREVLYQLAIARANKLRPHFHTGSGLVRLLMADDDEGFDTLPTYQIESLPVGGCGDWEHAYIFKALPDPEPTGGIYEDVGNVWSIGYVGRADGAPVAELEKQARWFSEEEFSSFVEEAFQKRLSAEVMPKKMVTGHPGALGHD